MAAVIYFQLIKSKKLPAAFKIDKNMKFTFCLFPICSLLNIFTFAQQSIIIKKDTVGGATVTYQTTHFTKNDSSVIFINVHEDESTSVQAAKQTLEVAKKYCLTQLQFRGMRFVSFTYKGKSFTIDPNRIYTSAGALASIKKNSPKCSPELLAEVLKAVNNLGEHYTNWYINDKKLVVALHNNTNGEPLSIITYKSGSESRNAKEVYMNLQKDPDDFFLTTEKSIFNFLKAKGFNVALQDNENVLDDGSLSVYAGKKNIPYVNIEAQKFHLQEQKEMMEAMLEYIKSKNL